MVSALNVGVYVLLICLIRGEEELCMTRNDEILYGRCVLIKECPELMSWIKKSITDREYLKYWHCGFEGEVPKVCCPPPETTTMATRTANRIHTRCITGRGTIGACVEMESCPKIANKWSYIIANFGKNDNATKEWNSIVSTRCNGNQGPNILSVCCEMDGLS